MYYRHRKMEVENQQFVHRIGQLPVVKAACERAVSAYATTKTSNRLYGLVGATLQYAENGVKYAVEADAVKKLLHHPLTNVANKIAVDQLDKIEQKYPSVHKTPEELWNDSKNYYDTTRVKKTVDTAYAVKDYGLNKVTDTKQYCNEVVAATLQRGVETLDNLLTESDALVDKYITVHCSDATQCSAQTGSYINRVQCITGKAYNGMKVQAGTKYETTKEYIMQTLGDMQTAMALLEYGKNSAAWANNKTHATLTVAQEQAKALWQEFQRRAEPMTERSEVIILGMAKNLANAIASLSDQMVKYSSPYVSDSAGKTMVAASSYAHELREAFLKANTLGDLRDEIIAESKEKLGVLQQQLLAAVDYIVDVPPVSWLAVNIDIIDLQGHELLGMDRDARRPGSPRVILPIIEPRAESHAHSG